MKANKLILSGAMAAGGLFSALASSGCQTHVAGMTLPSEHYLEHPPQYFPPSPAFPLNRELRYQEETAAKPNPGAGTVR
jgi:hypothetical protein